MNKNTNESFEFFKTLSEKEKKIYIEGMIQGMEYIQAIQNSTPEELLDWFKRIEAAGIPVPKRSFETLERICEYRKNKGNWFSSIFKLI